MLSPDMKEEITGTAEIREVYKISKVGNVAGSMVLTGKIFRASKVRVIRDSIVVFTGEFATLKRFKDDAKEVVYEVKLRKNKLQLDDVWDFSC